VNIPAAVMGSAEKQFPDSHSAAIVFYADRDEDLDNAMEWAREWEYRNATVFPGGVKAWQAAGNQLLVGPTPTKINYVRKLVEGEVSIKEFEEIVRTASHPVIDARTADEFAKAHFPGAVNIPAEEMAVRYAEIPAGKMAVVHCSTGTRAELAFDILKEKGVMSRYLRANVEFGSGNKVVIKE
jgi:rhodanese-related sulfurtransferase